MKHGLVTRRIADSIVEGQRTWVYVQPAGSAFEGRIEIVGFSVEIGLWVKIILIGDNLLFNGFVLDRTAELDGVREFIGRSSRER